MVQAFGAMRQCGTVLTFPGELRQVKRVREALSPLLDRFEFPRADDAILIASELAANAVVHSRSSAPCGQFILRAEIYPLHYVWIEVEDQGGAWVPRPHDAERPHGLDLVDKFAGPGNWGIDGDSLHGRQVWARLCWSPRPLQA